MQEGVNLNRKETEHGGRGVCAVGPGAGEAGARPRGSRGLETGEAELMAVTGGRGQGAYGGWVGEKGSR